MPKVIVEFDLPEGQAIPDPREIVMLTSPDWMASWWHIDDVKSTFNSEENNEEFDVTDAEAREVLRRLHKYHDSSVGINWDVIECHCEDVVNERKKVA